jgi:hypothetical protein
MPQNLGQLYEEKIKSLLRKRNLLPMILEGNDAGFIHKGVSYFVEVKNKTAPDFGQKGLIWDKTTKKWRWREDDVVSQLYDALGVIDKIDPNFIPKRYTVESPDRLTEKDKQDDRRGFEKRGIPLGNLNYLYEFYARKKCYYIQIEGKGIYFLKQDIAILNVPRFTPELTLRLRAKTHHSIPIHSYSFFAVIQAQTRRMFPSPFDIEENSERKFPPIIN